jgi:hypothetical protein
VRAGSIHLNEVAWPQSPGAESGGVPGTPHSLRGRSGGHLGICERICAANPQGLKKDVQIIVFPTVRASGIKGFMSLAKTQRAPKNHIPSSSSFALLAAWREGILIPKAFASQTHTFHTGHISPQLLMTKRPNSGDTALLFEKVATIPEFS